MIFFIEYNCALCFHERVFAFCSAINADIKHGGAALELLGCVSEVEAASNWIAQWYVCITSIYILFISMPMMNLMLPVLGGIGILILLFLYSPALCALVYLPMRSNSQGATVHELISANIFYSFLQFFFLFSILLVNRLSIWWWWWLIRVRDNVEITRVTFALN